MKNTKDPPPVPVLSVCSGFRGGAGGSGLHGVFLIQRLIIWLIRKCNAQSRNSSRNSERHGTFIQKNLLLTKHMQKKGLKKKNQRPKAASLLIFIYIKKKKKKSHN